MLLGLAACGGYIKNEGGSENLIRLDMEPKGCEYLYEMNTEAVVYDQGDAYRYLENNIVKQPKTGNAYFVVDMKRQQRPGIVFGPEKSYVFQAKVYKCPELEND